MLAVLDASRTKRNVPGRIPWLLVAQVVATKEQATTEVAAVRLASANVRKTTVYFFLALRVITNGRYAVADVPLMSAVVTNAPPHNTSYFDHLI